MPSFRTLAAIASFSALLLASPALAQNTPVPDAPDWSRAPTVPLAMTNYQFTPDALLFRANLPYRLRLTNNASGGHSFHAPEFFAAVTVVSEDQAKIVKGEIEVESGQTVEVKFVPKVSGTYEFHCSHFLHASFGMTGTVVVR
jgi:FtsP/CotA-like multicopper oxidase with cupredoxin domain